MGTSREGAEAAVRRGDPDSAVFEPVLLQVRLERTLSPAAIEAQGGPPAAESSSIMEGFGFPPVAADEAAFTPTEADVLIQLNRLRDIWAPELTLQLARLYGRMLARIAGAEIQMFRQYTMPKLHSDHSRTRRRADGSTDGLRAAAPG